MAAAAEWWLVLDIKFKLEVRDFLRAQMCWYIWIFWKKTIGLKEFEDQIFYLAHLRIQPVSDRIAVIKMWALWRVVLKGLKFSFGSSFKTEI